MAALIEARELTKHFTIGRHQTVHAVDAVSLAIAEREVVGLVGESGSGKSTFGRTLVGLYEKTGGEVLFAGERLPAKYASADFRRFASQIQMIFQDPYSSLNPRMTVGEIIGEGLRIGGGDADALIMQPKFVVCDEPISALDVSVQAQIVRLLGELKSSLGLTMLFIAHDLSMVRYVSDRMAVMYLGSLVEIGTADDVYFRPKHPYTEILVASNPQADPRTERTRKPVAIKGEIASPINVRAGCRFASRCPKVMDVCRSVTPELRPVADGGAGSRVACHLFPAAK